MPILKEYCVDISKTDVWCAKIRTLVEERLASSQASSITNKDDDVTPSVISDEDIATMLDNINIFDN